MKFKTRSMFDIITGKVVFFLVFSQITPRTRWLPCHEDGKPLLFATKQECDAKVIELTESEPV